MILVIDIGNTNIVLGIYKGEELIRKWRISTGTHRTSDEYLFFLRGFLAEGDIDPKMIQHTLITSVVHPIVRSFMDVAKRLTENEVTVITGESDLGIDVLIDNKKELGSDRLVNAFAGFERYASELVIVDFGTATTFDVISSKGEYLGGLILPGINIAIEALHDKTSQLPRVEIELPKTVIGKNTVHSMQSGILFGYAGMIDSLVEKISNELQSTPKVIATGGLAVRMRQVSESIEEVWEDLTLWGLYRIYDKFIRSKTT